ncbi:MAG: hypothetical protein IPG39_24340 [Bacteroidetes bacterium]|nr:hypothetical protein [Bacteroidota bacterium]
MKRIAIIFSIIVSFCNGSSAQNVLDGVYVREHVPVRNLYNCPTCVKRCNVVQKSLENHRSLKEKMNLPFYYPTEKINDRLSLNDILITP